MHRLLIAAAGAALLAASVAPALADDYPPCRTHDQDHCRVVMGHPWAPPHHGHHHPMMRMKHK